MSQASSCWRRSLLAFPLCLLLVAGLAGCGSKLGTVSGTVTYKGEKLKSGSVEFTGNNNQGDSAIIQPDGTYTAGKVPLGSVKVTVTTNAGASAGGMKPPPPLPGMPPVPEAVPIPLKYKDTATSGLSLEVKSGRQTYDIPLQ
jgi:hypothetical protein